MNYGSKNIFFLLVLVVLFFAPMANAQRTRIHGTVWDSNSGERLPFVKVQFKNSKMGTLTDTLGRYELDTYYATDSVQFILNGYLTYTVVVEVDKDHEIYVKMITQVAEIQEIVIRPPDELPSTRLHKRVIANKKINNKEKLLAYQYEVYNKMQLDLNNIGEKFSDFDVVKRLDLVMNYLNSGDNGKSILPVLLSESLSNFYFRKNPSIRREIVQGNRITGIDNLQVSQFLGDIYLDINIYDNYINMFNRAFISPLADYARSFYRFYLDDSTFIDNKWCYKLSFVPKRTGDLTFQGEMWIHDTTYAVKSISAHMSPWANINYVQAVYFEHNFDQVAKEVWMLTKEKMIVDFKLTKNTEIYGFLGRKLSSRTNFVINEKKIDSFYHTDNTVEFEDSAKLRTKEWWITHRHEPLSEQEIGIVNMVDSLNNMPFFKQLKNISYALTTGYYPIRKVEVGNVFSLISFNPVENFRAGIALRTSNKFSKRLEIGGRLGYGFKDDRFKYGASVRYNLTPKKRGMLTSYYNYDIEQIGISPSAASIGSTFGTVFRTGPLDKLTFVKKAGINLEKDIKKDIVLYGGFEWKEYMALGKANYIQLNKISGQYDTTQSIRTSELTARIRWTKDEEFISGTFDRSTLRSKYPIFSIQGIFGLKGFLGGLYDYQRIEFQMEHNRQIGLLGRIRYGVTTGYIFGSAAYPFLKVHEGNQSYWLLTTAFNKLNFFEFVSDRYMGGFIENHWEGLFFDRIPLLKKLEWRLVTTGRFTYGSIAQKNLDIMKLPDGTRFFGNVPYVEAAIGIENIFKVGRVDLVYRLTHLDYGMKPFGIRARWALIF
jgi:hypothetical protein